MNVFEAMDARHSARAYLDRDVEDEKIERILTHAARAPSGANTQPWRVAVVSGGAKRAIETRMERAWLAGDKGGADYQYYPASWTEPYRARRIACGRQLYESLGIQREDKARRRQQWLANYRAFGAPVVLYFYMEARLETGSYLDCGMFLQSVMLGAIEEGLATCPQAALSEYPSIVKEGLGLGEGWVLLCGMALGYEDVAAPINRYRTPRTALDEFISFHRD